MDSLLSWSYFASQNNDKKNRPMHFLDCHGQLQKKHKCTIQGTLCIPENGIILSLFSVYYDRWLALLKLRTLAKEDEVWTHHWEDMGTDRGQPYLCTVINYSSLTLKDVANNWNILGWK